MGKHLTSAEVKAFKERRCDPVDLAWIDEHLAACRSCRALVAEGGEAAAFGFIRAIERSAAGHGSEAEMAPSPSPRQPD